MDRLVGGKGSVVATGAEVSSVVEAARRVAMVLRPLAMLEIL